MLQYSLDAIDADCGGQLQLAATHGGVSRSPTGTATDERLSPGAGVAGPELRRARKLWRACCEGDIAQVKAQLQLGAAVDSPMDDRTTPLHLACQDGHEGVASFLVERGAAVNCEACNGATPLHLACQYGHESTVRLLLARGGARAGLQRLGPTCTPCAMPLQLACRYGHAGVVRLLLALRDGVDDATVRHAVNCAAVDGTTVLQVGLAPIDSSQFPVAALTRAWPRCAERLHNCASALSPACTCVLEKRRDFSDFQNFTFPRECSLAVRV